MRPSCLEDYTVAVWNTYLEKKPGSMLTFRQVRRGARTEYEVSLQSYGSVEGLCESLEELQNFCATHENIHFSASDGSQILCRFYETASLSEIEALYTLGHVFPLIHIPDYTQSIFLSEHSQAQRQAILITPRYSKSSWQESDYGVKAMWHVIRKLFPENSIEIFTDFYRPFLESSHIGNRQNEKINHSSTEICRELAEITGTEGIDLSLFSHIPVIRSYLNTHGIEYISSDKFIYCDMYLPFIVSHYMPWEPLSGVKEVLNELAKGLTQSEGFQSLGLYAIRHEHIEFKEVYRHTRTYITLAGDCLLEKAHFIELIETYCKQPREHNVDLDKWIEDYAQFLKLNLTLPLTHDKLNRKNKI